MARKKTLADELYNARRILKRQNERMKKQLLSASAKEKRYISEAIERNNRKIDSMRVNRKKGIEQNQLNLARSISESNTKLRKTKSRKEINKTILARNYIKNNRVIGSTVFSYLSAKNKGKKTTEEDAIREAWKIKRAKDPKAAQPDILEAYEILINHITGRELQDIESFEDISEYDPSPASVIMAQSEMNHNVSTNVRGAIKNAQRKAKKERKKR